MHNTLFIQTFLYVTHRTARTPACVLQNTGYLEDGELREHGLPNVAVDLMSRGRVSKY